jgi:N-acetylglucosamine-6-phosphate deacetylase
MPGTTPTIVTQSIVNATNILTFLGVLAVYGGFLYAAFRNALSKKWNEDIDKKTKELKDSIIDTHIKGLKDDLKQDIEAQKKLTNSQLQTLREGITETKSAILRYSESTLAAQMSISQIQGKLTVIENRGKNKDD